MLAVANTAGMIEHLRLISHATAKDRHIDRAGWHTTKAIHCFSNITLLPYYAIAISTLFSRA
ncbi:MAG: hypothetical protein HFP77_06370 [Methylococcales symbiont of Iophon sp. n. MRB-2018]|nr:MAG: hypothetical protein HFP77_06370 [Methylococcales symbiont of Iophon sp. n. MRB-2018]KAF3979827.1 MAG: hypothetical protein HFP76_05350 [Methylococcales symbiont of Iophon sp. n. MRB-2018]